MHKERMMSEMESFKTKQENEREMLNKFIIEQSKVRDCFNIFIANCSRF